MVTYPDPSITYHKSDMCLCTLSDSSYFCATNDLDRVGAYHLLGNKPNPTIPLKEQHIIFNSPMYVEARILKPVMSAESEAHAPGDFVNARQCMPKRKSILEMKHA